jgi:hypothetical protein
MVRTNSILLFLLSTLPYLISRVYGFYVPGVAPQDFSTNDKVDVKVTRK